MDIDTDEYTFFKLIHMLQQLSIISIFDTAIMEEEFRDSWLKKNGYTFEDYLSGDV